MAEIIRMPRLSDTMEEGVIVSWLKKEGDKVVPGDILAEVETDKATMELESFYEGILLHIGIKEGAVPVDDVIAVIGEEGEDYKKVLAEANAGEVEKTEKADVPVVSQSIEATKHDDQNLQNKPLSGRIKASPLAKRMAKDAGIDLAQIQGSGDGGRIIKADIQNFRPSPVLSNTHTSQGYTDIPISQMRKTIAKRLGESKFTSPHFYLTMAVEMDRCWDARKSINKNMDIKISFNDIIVKASALALKKHPMVNSSWLEDKIRIHKDVHIGVAVAVDDGLLVPVIRHADQKSLVDIHHEVRDRAARAREKKLGIDEMQGNTFTISNLGMFGIEEFTAIINRPDACILAVGGIMDKAVVKDGQITVAKMMNLTLSCDHRIVDGVTGSKFLLTLKQYLEEPLSMLA